MGGVRTPLSKSRVPATRLFFYSDVGGGWTPDASHDYEQTEEFRFGTQSRFDKPLAE